LKETNRDKSFGELTISIVTQKYNAGTSTWVDDEQLGSFRLDSPSNTVKAAFLTAKLDDVITEWNLRPILLHGGTAAADDIRIQVRIDGASNVGSIELRGYYAWVGNTIFRDASRFY